MYYDIRWSGTAGVIFGRAYVNLTASRCRGLGVALASVMFTDYNTGLMSEMLNVTFVDQPFSTLTSLRPFPGFAFPYSPPPVLTSISGCNRSGVATLGCDPETTLLTFTDSGCLWFKCVVGQRLLNLSSQGSLLWHDRNRRSQSSTIRT